MAHSNQIGPSVEVDPIISPRGRGGLITSVEVVTHGGASDEERRWENGYTWRPLGGCGQAGIFAPCSDDVKDVPASEAIVEVVPPTIYAGFKCSSWGLVEDERIAHAESRLNAREGQAIEAELWKGTMAQANTWPNPYLAGPATVVLTTSSPYPFALGALQDALADCLGSENIGVIHCTRTTASIWASAHLIKYNEKDGFIEDLFGNRVVAGGGYDGSSPAGIITPTVPYAYATGFVRVEAGPVYMTPDTTAQAFDRGVNDITWYAERTASAAFDSCCVFGIGVDLDSGPF